MQYNIAVLVYSTFDMGIQFHYFRTTARTVEQLPVPTTELLQSIGLKDVSLGNTENEWAKWHNVIGYNAMPIIEPAR